MSNSEDDDEVQIALIGEAAAILGRLDGNMIDAGCANDLRWACTMIQDMYNQHKNRKLRAAINAELEQIAQASETVVTLMRGAHLETLSAIADAVATKRDEGYDSNKHFQTVLSLGTAAQSLSRLARMTKDPPQRGRPVDRAKRMTVSLCHYLYGKYRTDSPTTYGDGDYHRFCQVMYELATEEKEMDLSRHIRTVQKNHHDAFWTSLERPAEEIDWPDFLYEK